MSIEAGNYVVNASTKNALESGVILHQQIVNYTTLIIFTIGSFGNLLIIIYFTKVDKKKFKSMSAYHFLLTLLAILDCSVCVLKIVNTALMLNYFNDRITGESNVGRVYRCLTSASIYVLVIISYLRYRKITSPFRPAWSKKTYFILCFLNLLFCTGIWLFLILFPFNGWQMIDPIVFGVVPLIMLSFFYYKMVKILNINRNNNSKIKSKEYSNCATVVNDRRSERNMVALKTVKYLTVIYFLTVVFVKVVVFSFVVQPSIRKNFKSIYISYIDFFYLINNIANVFVYAKLMRGFCCFLQNVFTCGRRPQVKSSSSMERFTYRSQSYSNNITTVM